MRRERRGQMLACCSLPASCLGVHAGLHQRRDSVHVEGGAGDADGEVGRLGSIDRPQDELCVSKGTELSAAGARYEQVHCKAARTEPFGVASMDISPPEEGTTGAVRRAGGRLASTQSAPRASRSGLTDLCEARHRPVERLDGVSRQHELAVAAGHPACTSSGVGSRHRADAVERALRLADSNSLALLRFLDSVARTLLLRESHQPGLATASRMGLRCACACKWGLSVVSSGGGQARTLCKRA